MAEWMRKVGHTGLTLAAAGAALCSLSCGGKDATGPADVAGPSTGSIFTEIWHFDGAGWKKVYTSPTELRAIWGSSAEDVFVVGDQGLILHGTL